MHGAVPGCVKMGRGASLICSLHHILQPGHVLPGILVAERFHCAIQGDNSKGAVRNVNGVLTFCTSTGRFTCSLQSLRHTSEQMGAVSHWERTRPRWERRQGMTGGGAYSQSQGSFSVLRLCRKTYPACCFDL